MAKAASPIITPCPVARLALEAVRVLRARERAERKNTAAFEALQDRLAALEEAASYERATSAIGAFFQALLISGDLDPASMFVRDDCAAKKDIRRLRRLVASLSTFVEDGVEREAADTLREYYLTRDLDDLGLMEGYIDAGATAPL